MSAKVELVWTEDNRSIGIMEDNDEHEKYRPLIMLNFKFLGYISSECNPYRGYQILVQLAGGTDFINTVSERELQRLGDFTKSNIMLPLLYFQLCSFCHGREVQDPWRVDSTCQL